MEQSIQEYLTEGEDIEQSWTGNVSGQQSGDANFIATDRRLIYLTNDENFKDISYEHIKSVEANSEKDYPFLHNLGSVSIFTGVALALWWVVSGFPNSIVILPLFILLVGGGVSLTNKHQHDAIKIHNITVVMGKEEEENLEFESQENVGATLSRLIRQ
jgi:hypothetical protein